MSTRVCPHCHGTCREYRTEHISYFKCDGCGEIDGARAIGSEPAPQPDTARCSSCGDPIIWIRARKKDDLAAATGKPMPCNPTRRTIITKDGHVTSGWESHFSTCPNADKHRRRPGE